MIFKLIVGNEHGGAMTSISLIVTRMYSNTMNKVVCITDGALHKRLKEQGHVNLYCLNCSEPPIIASSHPIKKITNYFKFGCWILQVLFRIYVFAKKNSMRIVHTTNNHALLICCLLKFIIPSVHIISHWRCVGLGSANPYRRFLYKVNTIICISNVVRKSLPKPLQLKCIVIWNGLDINEIHSEGERRIGHLINSLKIDPRARLVGTIGTFSPIKSHELIIESFNLFKKEFASNFVHAVLIGSTPNVETKEYKGYLKSKIRKYGLEKYITVVDDVNIGTPATAISDLKLFIGTTWNGGKGEGFGLMYLEAMANKVPVVAIDIGAASEIFEDQVSGYLIPENSPNLLAEIIRKTYLLPKELQLVGESGHTLAKERFDITNTIRLLQLEYSKIGS